MWYEMQRPGPRRGSRVMTRQRLGLAVTVMLGAGAIALAGAVVEGAFAAPAAPVLAWKSVSVTLPYPGPHFSGHGASLLNPSCSTCHSADFVNGQPYMPLATWKAEVLKMKNVFHAPVAAKNVDALAQILFARHPAAAK